MSKLTDFPVYSEKTKKRAKYGLVGSGLIVILVMAMLLSRTPVMDPLNSKITVVMTAQVYREGVLIDERIKDDDLLLSNFINMTQALLYWPDGSQYEIELLTSGGQDFIFWNGTSQGTIFDCGKDMYSDVVVQGRYGIDNTAPERDDDSLGSQAEVANLDSSYLGVGYFTLTWIDTASGPFSWEESGFSMRWWSDYYGDSLNVFMCRDVFSAISVETSDTIVLNYRFNFGTGYNTNFIKILHCILKGTPNGVETTVSLTDTSGTSRTVTVYDADGSYDYIGHVDNSLYGGHVAVSDSSSGIPSRSAHVLLGSSLQVQASSITDVTNWNVEVSGVFVPTVPMTIRAATCYRYTTYGSGDAYFMMFALAHSPVYVAGSTPVKATFTLEM